MSILDPNQDAKALQPLIDKAVQDAMGDLTKSVVPALGLALRDALAGLVITISVEKIS